MSTRPMEHVEVWAAATVSAVAVLAIPVYLGVAGTPPLGFMGYAAVAGIALAVGDWLDSGLRFIEDPAGLLIDASAWALATAVFGGMAFLVSLLL